MNPTELDRIRRSHAKLAPKNKGMGHFARMQDEKLTKEHAYELNRKNVCSRCFMVKTTRGVCSMGCDD